MFATHLEIRVPKGFLECGIVLLRAFFFFGQENLSCKGISKSVHKDKRFYQEHFPARLGMAAFL